MRVSRVLSRPGKLAGEAESLYWPTWKFLDSCFRPEAGQSIHSEADVRRSALGAVASSSQAGATEQIVAAAQTCTGGRETPTVVPQTFGLELPPGRADIYLQSVSTLRRLAAKRMERRRGEQ